MSETEIFYPETTAAWRKWLERNHTSKSAVWLIFYNRKSNKKSISWSEAVDVALCFGWIDSKKVSVDEETAHQFFSRRKDKSTWSKINKNKIAALTKAGLMTEAGLKAVETAKKNGSWNLLDDVEALIVPKDLEEAFAAHDGARQYFDSLSKSMRKNMLQWVVLAKRPETRQNRINEIAELAAAGKKPKQF